MIKIQDATAALAPKPEGFRLTGEWQMIRTGLGVRISVRQDDLNSVELVGSSFIYTITDLRELSAFCTALADYLERGQG